jgi:hypothetical protein
MLRSLTFGMLSTPPPYSWYKCRTMASDSYTVSPVFGSECARTDISTRRVLLLLDMKITKTVTSIASSLRHQPMSKGNCSFPPCSCAAGLCLMESFGVGNTSTCARYQRLQAATDQEVWGQQSAAGVRMMWFTSRSRSVIASRTRLQQGEGTSGTHRFSAMHQRMCYASGAFACLQNGQASNSKSCSVCAGSLLRAAAPGPTLVPKGSRDIDEKPEVATSAQRARGAAASPPADITAALASGRT